LKKENDTSEPNPDSHTPENRVQMYEEIKKQKADKDESDKKSSMFAHIDEINPKKTGISPALNANGKIR
jgi:hypothetical protein